MKQVKSALVAATALTLLVTACGDDPVAQAASDAQLCRELTNKGRDFHKDVWERLYLAGNTRHVTENIPRENLLSGLQQIESIGSGGEAESASPMMSQTFTKLKTDAHSLQEAARQAESGASTRELNAQGVFDGFINAVASCSKLGRPVPWYNQVGLQQVKEATDRMYDSITRVNGAFAEVGGGQAPAPQVKAPQVGSYLVGTDIVPGTGTW